MDKGKTRLERDFPYVKLYGMLEFMRLVKTCRLLADIIRWNRSGSSVINMVNRYVVDEN